MFKSPLGHFFEFSNLRPKQTVKDTIADVGASGLWPGKVVTEVTATGPFWEAPNVAAVLIVSHTHSMSTCASALAGGSSRLDGES